MFLWAIAEALVLRKHLITQKDLQVVYQRAITPVIRSLSILLSQYRLLLYRFIKQFIAFRLYFAPLMIMRYALNAIIFSPEAGTNNFPVPKKISCFPFIPFGRIKEDANHLLFKGHLAAYLPVS